MIITRAIVVEHELCVLKRRLGPKEIDRLGRKYPDVTGIIREFMRRVAIIETVINMLMFDDATTDPMQMAVRDALISFMAATAQATGRGQERGSEGRDRACQGRWFAPACLTPAKAWVSARMRTTSTAAFRIENTSATQGSPKTSGSTAISAATTM